MSKRTKFILVFLFLLVVAIWYGFFRHGGFSTQEECEKQTQSPCGYWFDNTGGGWTPESPQEKEMLKRAENL